MVFLIAWVCNGCRGNCFVNYKVWGYTSWGKNAKPHYKTFTWIAMNLCSALAAGVLIFGMCEWMYYVNGTPFGIKPGSIEAYEYASAYGMFHWGFSAWAFYLITGVALGYLYWKNWNITSI